LFKKLNIHHGESSEGYREEKVHQGGKPFQDGLRAQAFEDGKETKEK
jgi:hypothetical protein